MIAAAACARVSDRYPYGARPPGARCAMASGDRGALAPRWSGTRKQASDVQSSPVGSPIVAENDYSINLQLAPAIGPAGLAGQYPPAAQRWQTVRGKRDCVLALQLDFRGYTRANRGMCQLPRLLAAGTPRAVAYGTPVALHAAGAPGTQRPDNRPGGAPTDCLCNRFLVS